MLAVGVGVVDGVETTGLGGVTGAGAATGAAGGVAVDGEGKKLPFWAVGAVGVVVLGAGALVLTTRQDFWFSHPQPSPSGSELELRQLGTEEFCEEEVGAAGEVFCVEELELTTLQDLLFSHPQPSPSGSELEFRQLGCPEVAGDGEVWAVGDVCSHEELCGRAEDPWESEPGRTTRQVVLFSHPQPSPSGSESGVWQVGAEARALGSPVLRCSQLLKATIKLVEQRKIMIKLSFCDKSAP